MPKKFLTEGLRIGDVLHPLLDEEHISGLITEYYEQRGWNLKEGTIKPENDGAHRAIKRRMWKPEQLKVENCDECLNRLI